MIRRLLTVVYLSLSSVVSFATNPYTDDIGMFSMACENAGIESDDVFQTISELQGFLDKGQYISAIQKGAPLARQFADNLTLRFYRPYGDFIAHYALAHYLAGQLNTAVSYFIKELEFLDDNEEQDTQMYPLTLLWLSEIFSKKNNLFEAKEFLKKAEKFHLGNDLMTRYAITKSSIYELEGKWKDALTPLQSIENPTPSVKNKIRHLRFITGEKEEVIQELKGILGKDPELTMENLELARQLAGYLAFDETTRQEALELGKRIVDFCVERKIMHLPQFPAALSDYSMWLKWDGKYAESKENLIRALKALDNYDKNNTSKRINYLERLAEVCYLNGDYEQAAVNANNHFILSRRIIPVNFLRPEGRRDSYWEHHGKWYVSDFPKIMLSFPFPNSVGLCYDALLTGKGMMNYSDKVFAELADKLGGEAKAHYNRYVDLNILAKEEKDLIRYSQLMDERDREFDEFAAICRKSKEFHESFNFKWQDVAQSLGAGESAVEFYEYTDKDGVEQYGAIVISAGDSIPKIKAICDGKALENVNTKETDKRMWQTVWEPLMPLLQQSEKIYFSPAGKFYVMPIEYSDTDSRKKYVRLTSTRMLMDRDENSASKKDSSMVLYGGLTYNMTQSSMQKEHQKYGQRRGGIYDYLRHGAEKSIEPLENTLYEVEEIATLAKKSMGKEPVLFTETRGVEESFKAHSGAAPDVLHIATHGFFFNENNPQAERNLGSSTVDRWLCNSGLLLSGANKAFAEGVEVDDVEDGILTSREISELDLSNTDLAVLSACETGLGVISGDGVAGLQSAFKQAGVKELLMSLWKVDDEATAEFMKEFYQGWLVDGLSKNEALGKAQTHIRNYPGRPHWSNPDYWAAFVLLDSMN